MPEEFKLSYTVAMVLQAISVGHEYGYSVMEATGLPSGTVYPALGRLERDGLILSHWEQQAPPGQTYRPPRRYYKTTDMGRTALKMAAEQSHLAKLAPSTEVQQV